MKQFTLAISDPPHGQVDLRKAAPTLGLAAADLRMKALYQVPEIWLADTDRRQVERATQTLRKAGLNVRIVGGHRLLEVPPQGAVISFSFRVDRFVAALAHATATLVYDEQVFAVFHTPADLGDARPSGLLGARTNGALGVVGAAGQPKDFAFFDIYRSREGEVMRLWIVQDGVDFSGLGDQKVPSQAGNMRKFVAEWESRFQRATIDRRLVNLQLRQPMTPVTPGPALEQRKGFSFASRGLSQLLDTIAPDLQDTGHADFSSRLVYLTTRYTIR